MREHFYEQIDNAMELIQKGDVEEGLDQLKKLIPRAGRDPEMIFRLADIFYELGHLDTALALLIELEPFFHEVPTDMQIEIRALRAEMLIDVGQFDHAIEELTRCLEIEPDHARSNVLLADAYLVQNLPEVACRYLERVVKAHDDETDVAFFLSKLYVDLGEWEKALDLFDRLEETEYKLKAAIEKANLYSRLGRFEEAYALFQMARAAEPTSEAALFGCCATALRLHQYEAAIELSDQLLALNEDHLGARQLKGEALWEAGRLEEAKKAFEEALERCEHEETLYLKLIELCYVQSDYDEAERYIHRLLALDDDHELAKMWQKRLNDVRSK